MLAERERWPEAEAAFRSAAETPSLLAVREPALFRAAVSEWVLAGPAGAAPDPGMKARALGNTRKVVALGPVLPHQAFYLSLIALEYGELDLARGIIADWERQAPTDLDPLRRRLAVELKAGAYGPAIAVADRILARQPKDAAALRSRATAIDRLRKQAQNLSPEQGPPKGRLRPAQALPGRVLPAIES